MSIGVKSSLMKQKCRYFLWAAARQFTEGSCPACGSRNHQTIKRKAIVTTLFECSDCGLRYRFPKMSQVESDSFYQSHYAQGFTTDLPSDEELTELKKLFFRGTEKDYSYYIAVLRDAGIQSGASIL